MEPFPKLETTRLLLNETTLADTDSVFALLSNPRVLTYYDIEQFQEIDQAASLINSDAGKYAKGLMLRWAVRQKESSKYIGGCGINRFEADRHTAVIGYEFCPSTWGKGFATESLQAVIEFCFSTHCPQHVNRIEAYTMTGNHASEAILGKLGFSREGLLRQHSFWKGSYHDLTLFSILRDEFNH
ncbi:GNAT family N-acetyltransferase [Shewanella sp. UCD-KL12]|uniref:GNAT family N-acetyltransferase n=1 Tax=Shewanella sp. UCD-KL12 TaxID=1917163 RepID=UPI0009708B0D|nr:GNAT family protein [Shewanella sp. UCD-KL12]